MLTHGQQASGTRYYDAGLAGGGGLHQLMTSRLRRQCLTCEYLLVSSLAKLYSYFTVISHLLLGATLADAVMLVGTVDVVFGSVDL